MNPVVILVILCVALSVHYIAQKQLLKKGLTEADPKPQIRRLLVNGSTLLFFGVIAILAAQHPYNFFGILLFFEGAVCIAFARKLSKKPTGNAS